MGSEYKSNFVSDLSVMRVTTPAHAPHHNMIIRTTSERLLAVAAERRVDRHVLVAAGPRDYARNPNRNVDYQGCV